jgi:hypothetical protein
VTGVFKQITVLNLVNVFVTFLPALLGPGTSIHRNIKSLTLYSDTQNSVVADNDLLFLFEIMQGFLDSEWCIEWSGKLAKKFPDRFSEGCDKDAVVATLVEEAHADYAIFSKVFNLDGADWDGPLDETFEHGKPKNLSTWTSLETLNIQLVESLSMCLIFYSPAFPALRRLTLHGKAEFPHRVERGAFLTFRTAIHSCVLLSAFSTFWLPADLYPSRSLDTPGKFFEPELEFESGDAEVEWAGWGPPSADELANSRKPPYIGPKLEYLDMSRFTVYVPW